MDQRVRATLFQVARTFARLNPKIVVPLNCSLVRPYEYAIQATFPYLKKSVNYVERTQCLVKHKIKGTRPHLIPTVYK